MSGGRVFTPAVSFTKPSFDVWAGARTCSTSTDTIAAGDLFTFITYNYPGALSVGLPAGLTVPPTCSYATGGVVSFFAGWFCVVKKMGPGALTIVPGNTINGAGVLTVPQDRGALIWNAGPEYRALLLG